MYVQSFILPHKGKNFKGHFPRVHDQFYVWIMIMMRRRLRRKRRMRGSDRRRKRKLRKMREG